VMVDWGYNRAISPGTPQRAQLIPRINPITAVVDLAGSVVEGVHNFIGDLTPVAAATAPTKRADRQTASAPAQSVRDSVKATPATAAAAAARHHRLSTAPGDAPTPSHAPDSASGAASAHTSRKAAA